MAKKTQHVDSLIKSGLCLDTGLRGSDLTWWVNSHSTWRETPNRITPDPTTTHWWCWQRAARWTILVHSSVSVCVWTQIAGWSCSRSYTNKHIPLANQLASEIAVGNMWAQIAPYSLLMFQRLVAAHGGWGWSWGRGPRCHTYPLQTGCRRVQLRPGPRWSQAGAPR